MLAGGNKSVRQFNSNLKTAKAMRTPRQFIFLSISIFRLYCRRSSTRSANRSTKAPASARTLLSCSPPGRASLSAGCRASCPVPAFNYFNLGNYGCGRLVRQRVHHGHDDGVGELHVADAHVPDVAERFQQGGFDAC